MTQAEVKDIVRKMVNAGEPEGAIKNFIQEAIKRNSLGKKKDSATSATVESPLAQKSMGSKSVNGSLVSPLKQSVNIEYGDFKDLAGKYYKDEKGWYTARGGGDINEVGTYYIDPKYKGKINFLEKQLSGVEEKEETLEDFYKKRAENPTVVWDNEFEEFVNVKKEKEKKEEKEKVNIKKSNEIFRLEDELEGGKINKDDYNIKLSDINSLYKDVHTLDKLDVNIAKREVNNNEKIGVEERKGEIEKIDLQYEYKTGLSIQTGEKLPQVKLDDVELSYLIDKNKDGVITKKERENYDEKLIIRKDSEKLAIDNFHKEVNGEDTTEPTLEQEKNLFGILTEPLLDNDGSIDIKNAFTPYAIYNIADKIIKGEQGPVPEVSLIDNLLDSVAIQRYADANGINYEGAYKIFKEQTTERGSEDDVFREHYFNRESFDNITYAIESGEEEMDWFDPVEVEIAKQIKDAYIKRKTRGYDKLTLQKETADYLDENTSWLQGVSLFEGGMTDEQKKNKETVIKDINNSTDELKKIAIEVDYITDKYTIAFNNFSEVDEKLNKITLGTIKKDGEVLTGEDGENIMFPSPETIQRLLDEQKILASKTYNTEEEADEANKQIQSKQDEIDKIIFEYQDIAKAREIYRKRLRVTSEELQSKLNHEDFVANNVEDYKAILEVTDHYYGGLYRIAQRVVLGTADAAAGLHWLAMEQSSLYGLLSEENMEWHPANLVGIGSLAEMYAEVRDTYREEKHQQMSSQFTHYKDYADIKSIGDVAQHTAELIGGMAPMLVVTAMSGGTAGITLAVAQAGGLDLERTSKMNEQLGPLNQLTRGERYLSAVIHGAVEGITERLLVNKVTRVGNSLALDKTFQSGIASWLTQTMNIGTRAAVESVQEGFGEGMNAFVGNITDKYLLGMDVHLMDGVGTAWVDGMLISGGISSPMFIKNTTDHLMPDKTAIKLSNNASRILEIERKLNDPNLSNAVRLDLEAEANKLVSENNKLQDNQLKGSVQYSRQDKQDLIDIEVEKHNLKKKVENIDKDNSLSKPEKKAEKEKAKNKWNELNKQKHEILNKDTRTDEEKQVDYDKYVVEVRKKEEEHFKRTGEKIVIKELTKDEVDVEILEDQAVTQAEIDNTTDQLNDPEFIKYHAQKEGMTEQQVRDILEGNKKVYENQLSESRGARDQFGFIRQNTKTGEQKIIINKETSLAINGRITTAAHEFLHAVLFKTIGRDAGVQARLGNALNEFIGKKKGTGMGEFAARMEPYTFRNQKGEIVGMAENYGEEMITIMSESILDGTLKFDEGFFVKVGDIMRRFLQKKGFTKIKFNNGRQVYNFIKDYNDSIQKGYTNKAIDEVMDKGASGKLISGVTKKGSGTSYSKANALQNLYEKHEGDKTTLVSEGLSQDVDGNPVENMQDSELGDAMGAIVESITKRLFDPIPVSERNGITRKDYKDALITEAGAMIIKEYDPTKQSLDKFISNRLNNRAESLAKRLGVSQQFTEDITTAKGVAADDITTYETVDGQPTMADKLVSVDPELQVYVEEMKSNIDNGLDMLLSNEGMLLEIENNETTEVELREELETEKNTTKDEGRIKQLENEISNIIDNKTLEQQIEANNAELEILGMKDFDITKQDYKSLKDLNPETTQRMFGIVPKVGILTQPDIKAAQMVINNHADALAGGLPQGHTAGSKSTGVNKVLLEPFYNKRSIRAKTGPGEFVQKKKPMSAINTIFKGVFGMTERGQPNLVTKETNVSSRVKALVAQTGKLMSNQMVREFLIKSGHADAQLMVAISDGKSDVQFSLSPSHVSKVVGMMMSSDALKTNPHEAVELTSEVYEIDESEFGNLADRIKTRIDENLGSDYNFTELVPQSVTPNILEFDKNWNGFIKRKEYDQYAPLSKTNASEKKTFIVQSTSFLNTMPTVWLKNSTFKAIFANSTEGDFFNKMKELDAVIDEIIKARESNPNFKEPKGGNLVTDGLKFDSSLMGKITDVTIKYDGVEGDNLTKDQKIKKITKEVNAIIEKSGSNANDMRAGLNFVMDQLNSFINQPGADKITRGKFVATLLQNQTSKTTGIIRGAAFFKMISITPGKAHTKYKKGGGIESKNPGIGGAYLRDVLGLSDKAILLINNPNAKINETNKLKGETTPQMMERFEKEIENTLTPIAKENGFTYREYRDIMQEATMVAKTHHGEHIIALLLMTTNTFESMVDGTFKSKFPDIIKYYDQMALNEDFRVIIDQYFKTGMPANFFFGMNPFMRLTTVMPDIASDTIVLENGTTMDRVVAAELTLKQYEEGKISFSKAPGKFTPVVNKIKNASTPQQLGVINKNLNLIAKDPDLQSGFNNVIHNAANEVYYSKAPNNTSRSVKNLVDNINNISTIRKQRSENIKNYDLLNKDMTLKEQSDIMEVRNKAIMFSRKVNPSKGMSVWDFDDTIAKTKSNVLFTAPDGTTGKLNAEQYASQYVDLSQQGYEFDFSEFNIVVEGETGPFFKKFVDRINKFGVEDNFILTARPAESAPAIQEFLRSQGLEIPLENITGLANSTSEAKALWMTEKVSDGYNDIYFADDALQNVQAVKNVLDQFDIKSEVQQAKMQFSKSIDPTTNDILDSNVQPELDLNRILEQTKGVKAEAEFSDAQAKIRGSKKGRWKFWVPYSAEDFKGLIYRFVGVGRIGEGHMAFFKKALFDPFSRAHANMNAAKQKLDNQYRALSKQFKSVKNDLKKTIDSFEGYDSNFTVDQAIRVYLWNKAGFEVPGLSKRDLNTLVDFVESQDDIKAFADNLGIISNQEAGYTQPGEYWMVENIQSDINTINNEINRTDHLAEWKQNIEAMFGVWENGRLVGPNINKIEAIYGTKFRDALEDILWRMEFGTKREAGSNKLVNAFNNWANQSVGAIMFFNMRSALLQTISSINYLNWSDNNPLKAGMALANFPQFIKDFAMIFNSDMLKQRRAGNQRGINEAELAEAVAGSKNKPKAMLHWLLTKGFLPTQIADSFAIASGGATFFRNRVNSLLKQGLSQQEAEARAWEDFQENTEESQQSSRPDMISQQQASPLGRYILAFKNTPMQYARLMKKAFLDLTNGRGDAKTNVGKIVYYGVVQNLIFSSLQSALGAMIGDDDEEKETKAYGRTINSMIDSILGGLGIGGNAVATFKNMIMEYIKQEKKGWNADHAYTILKFLGFSPTIGSKVRKLYSAIQTKKFNEDVIKEMSFFDWENPIYESIANVISAITNVPLDRLYKKINNVDAAITEEISVLQRLALLMGWNTWDLDVDDSDIIAVEDEIKEKKETKKKEKKKIKKEIKKEKEEVNLENKNKELQKKEKEEGKKDIKCAAISKSGKRCKTTVESGSSYCTVHIKVEQGAKEVQCKKVKSNKKRCKMKTNAKSGLCYYHD